MKVRELVEQLLDHHPDAEVHFCWNGVVHRAIEQAVEGRVIEGQGGVLLRLDKFDWGKYPAARAVVLLQDEHEETENQTRGLGDVDRAIRAALVGLWVPPPIEKVRAVSRWHSQWR